MQTFHQFWPIVLGYGVGGNGLTAFGKFVDDRHIHIGIQGHSQRARDGGCRHNQLMWMPAFAL